MNRALAPFWNVILAAGDGTRLASLTRRLHGDDRPKQFAVLSGARSLLQETMERQSALAPAARTTVIVGAQHVTFAEAQLAPFRGAELVVQPRNRGTGPGLLLPLVHVRHQDPEALVVVSPSDHHFTHPGRFLAKVPLAAEAAAASRSGICLLAVEAEAPSPELGWIVPGGRLKGCRDGARIVRFIEKPDPLLAQGLYAAGSLWNTFVMVGRAGAFWDLARRHLPHHVSLFERYAEARLLGAGPAAQTLSALYRELPTADWSRDVLSLAEGLAVTGVSGSGWSDWGTPQRLMESLAGTPAFSDLQRRLNRTRLAA